MKKAKLLAAVLSAALAAASLAGCGSDSGTAQSSVATPQHKVFTTDSKSQKTAYLVVVQDAPVTEEQLEKIGQEQIDAAKTKNVFVSFSDTDVAGIPYTYGSMQRVNDKITKNFRLQKNWANSPRKTIIRFTSYSRSTSNRTPRARMMTSWAVTPAPHRRPKLRPQWTKSTPGSIANFFTQ